MRKMITAIALAGLAAAPAAADTNLASPAGQWTLDQSDSGCTVYREFTAGKERYFVHLNRYDGNPAMELVVLHEDKPDNEIFRVNGDLVIDDGELSYNPEIHRISVHGGFVRFGTPLDPASHRLASVDTSLTMKAGRLIDVRFATGPMAKAVEALESCAAGDMKA